MRNNDEFSMRDGGTGEQQGRQGPAGGTAHSSRDGRRGDRPVVVRLTAMSVMFPYGQRNG